MDFQLPQPLKYSLKKKKARWKVLRKGSTSSNNVTAQLNRTINLSDSDSTFTTDDVLNVEEQLNDKGLKTSDTQNTSSGSRTNIFEYSLSSDHFIGTSISIEGTTEKRMEIIQSDKSAVKTKVREKSNFRSSVLHKKFNKAVENDLAVVCSTSDFYLRVKNRVLGLRQSASDTSALKGVSYSKNGSSDENWENLNENEDLSESNKENIGGNTPGSEKSRTCFVDVRKRTAVQPGSCLNDFSGDKISEETPKNLTSHSPDLLVPDSEDSSIEMHSLIPSQLKSADLINKVDSRTSVSASLNGSDKSSLTLKENFALESSDSESTIQSNRRRDTQKVKKFPKRKDKTPENKNCETDVIPESDDSSSIDEYRRKRGIFVIDSSGSETSVTSKSEDSDGIEVIKVCEVDCVARNVSKGSNFSNKTGGALEDGKHKSGSSDLFRQVTKRTLILDSSDSVNNSTKDQEKASDEIHKGNEFRNLEFQPGFSTLSQSKHEDIRKWLSAIPCHPETDKPGPGDATKTQQPKPKGGEDENITLTDMEEVLSELYGKDWGDRTKFTPKVLPKKKESQIIIARLTDSDDSSTPPLPASTPKKRLYHKNNHIFTPQDGCFTPATGNILFTPLTSVGKKGKTSAIKTPRTDGPKSRVERACLQSGAFSSPVLTFLSSLSVGHQSARCHPEAKYFVKNFKTKKEELALKIFHIFNKNVFSSKLPHDLPILWNNRLRKTAGYCYNRRVKNSEGTLTRTSRIELSSKIVDNAGRLRDTLIHELCHAATWMISEVMGGHGPSWKRWTNKAMAAFPELPKISRCHNYDIVTKYKYQCTICNYSIGRHSKSLDIQRKVCGICGGKFELFLNAKDVSGKAVPKTPRTPNSFALFVKDNYKVMKASQSNLKHKDVMKLLSEQFAVTKISSTSNEQNNE